MKRQQKKLPIAVQSDRKASARSPVQLVCLQRFSYWKHVGFYSSIEKKYPREANKGIQNREGEERGEGCGVPE